MAPPRTRRLISDAEVIRKRFACWPPIEISGTAGIPPEVYRFTYRVKGLYVDAGGSILERDMHLLEVNLSLGYPRRAPQCRMLTPVFHPNFDEASICIGDFWAAAEGLDELVIRIGRMIAYQEYNIKSPLNGLAAKWAAQNIHLLPIDPRIIAPPTLDPVGCSPVIPTNPESRSLTPDAVAIPVSPANQETTLPEADPWREKIVLDPQL